MSSASPSQLGRYEIQAVLGKGSMGIVYLARDPLIGRLVALKTFRPNLGGDDEDAARFRTRFLREAQSAGILSHPNIVTVHDVVEGSEEEATFIAMEYVQGTNLKEVLRYGKPLEMAEVVEVLRQMAGSLDYAHGKGVVHRDVKPANVLLTPQRQVKLTDFGIARFEASNLTHDGQLLGTPNYMSPEQVQGREVDHRTDLFSLGVVLYEMITRQKPFSGESLTAVTHRIVYDKHTPLERYVGGMPEPITLLIDRALAKEPAKRFQTAQEMADELTGIVAVYERQIALSETQSIDDGVNTGLRAGAIPPPPDGSNGEATAAAGPAPTRDDPTPAGGVPRLGEASAHTYPSMGSIAAPASGTKQAGGTTGVGAGPAMAGGPSAPAGEGTEGAGGGLLGGFREWLRPEPGFGKPDWPRLGLAAAVVAVVVLGFGYLLQGWLWPEGEGLEAPTVAERVEKEYGEALREGRRAHERGDPEAAAAAFRRAEVLKPEEDGPRLLREAAERRAQMEKMSQMERERLTIQAAAAEEALAAGRYQEALSTALIVVESEPKSEPGSEADGEADGEALKEPTLASAEEVVRRARSALAREEQRRQQTLQAERAAAAEAAVVEEQLAEAEPQEAPTVPSSLSVLLETEGEGRLVVRVDGILMADVGYQHVEKVGVFRRKKPYRGETRLPGLDVEAGERAIRYEVRPAEGPPQTGTLDVSFPPGEARSLILVYSPGSTLAARVE